MLIESRDPHVKRIVAGGFAVRLSLPRGESLAGLHGTRRTAHIEDRGRAADERGFRPRFIVILRMRAHEREIDVGVRIDESGEDILAGSIDDFRARRWRIDVAVDPRDRLPFAPNVRDISRVPRDDFSVLNQEAHDGCVYRRSARKQRPLFSSALAEDSAYLQLVRSAKVSSDLHRKRDAPKSSGAPPVRTIRAPAASPP